MPVLLRRPRRVKLILPALTEATSPYWRPVKYSLFPPLGLATLAAYLDPSIEITLQDDTRLGIDWALKEGSFRFANQSITTSTSGTPEINAPTGLEALGAATAIAGLPGGWTEADLVTLLTTGKRPRGPAPSRPMPPFRMSQKEAAAVAAYLNSLR